MRKRIAISVMVILIGALGAGVWWQARPVVEFWRSGPYRPMGWGAFISGNRRFGCSWGLARYAIVRPGEPAKLVDADPMFTPGTKEPDEIVAARKESGTRITRIEANYNEVEYGRLRTTGIMRSSHVMTVLVAGSGGLSEVERKVVLRALFDDPRKFTAGSDLDGLGGVLFERYLDREHMSYLWKPLALSIGQALLIFAMVGAMVWMLWRIGWELRGGLRQERKRKGLCEWCGYPLGGKIVVCPECGPRVA